MANDFKETPEEKRARLIKAKLLGASLIIVLIVWYSMWHSIFD
jgi:hypothetical protein